MPNRQSLACIERCWLTVVIRLGEHSWILVQCYPIWIIRGHLRQSFAELWSRIQCCAGVSSQDVPIFVYSVTINQFIPVSCIVDDVSSVTNSIQCTAGSRREKICFSALALHVCRHQLDNMTHELVQVTLSRPLNRTTNLKDFFCTASMLSHTIT